MEADYRCTCGNGQDKMGVPTHNTKPKNEIQLRIETLEQQRIENKAILCFYSGVMLAQKKKNYLRRCLTLFRSSYSEIKVCRVEEDARYSRAAHILLLLILCVYLFNDVADQYWIESSLLRSFQHEIALRSFQHEMAKH